MSDFTITDHSDEVLQALAEQKEPALEAAGLQCEGYGMLELENPPRRIDTGNLRNSINHVLSGNEAVYIGTNVDYALYVHDGTSRMKPNRFMKNALYSHASEYIKIIEEYLKK